MKYGSSSGNSHNSGSNATMQPSSANNNGNAANANNSSGVSNGVGQGGGEGGRARLSTLLLHACRQRAYQTQIIEVRCACA